jgi:hypothetical protein
MFEHVALAESFRVRHGAAETQESKHSRVRADTLWDSPSRLLQRVGHTFRDRTRLLRFSYLPLCT